MLDLHDADGTDRSCKEVAVIAKDHASAQSVSPSLGFVPSRMFVTKGVGRHRENLQSFELALRDAKIEKFNLVMVSSIFPPGCKIINRTEGLKRLSPGQILPVVMSRNSTNEPNRLIAAGIGIAIPAEPGGYGYLSEHHSFGQTEKRCADYSEDLAAMMLATTLGLDIDPNTAYDQRREIYRMSGKIVRTRSIGQSAEGDKDGLWTTVVAASVLLP